MAEKENHHRSEHKYIIRFLRFFDYMPEQTIFSLRHPVVCLFEFIVTFAYVLGSLIIVFSSGITVAAWLATLLFSLRAVLKYIRSADDAKRIAIKRYGTENISHPKKNLLVYIALSIFVFYLVCGILHLIVYPLLQKNPSEFRVLYLFTFCLDKIAFLVLESIDLTVYTSSALVVSSQKILQTN